MSEHGARQRAKNPVKSTQTTFRIIEALRELDSAGITELAEYLDLSKSSVHNYLDTMRQEGYVLKNNQQYQISLQILDLGAYARHQRDIFTVGKPEVQRLAQETGEVANLLVEEQGLGIYIYRECGPQAVKLDTYTGMSVNLHHTALGKSILAHLPEERVETIINHHCLPARTDNTITDPEELYQELNDIREQGYALDIQEHLPGLQGAAVPILKNDTTVEGAISVAGPRSRMNGERLREVIPQKLKNAANIIELNITHS